jgi:hypothetical protein
MMAAQAKTPISQLKIMKVRSTLLAGFGFFPIFVAVFMAK